MRYTKSSLMDGGSITWRWERRSPGDRGSLKDRWAEAEGCIRATSPHPVNIDIATRPAVPKPAFFPMEEGQPHRFFFLHVTICSCRWRLLAHDHRRSDPGGPVVLAGPKHCLFWTLKRLSAYAPVKEATDDLDCGMKRCFALPARPCCGRIQPASDTVTVQLCRQTTKLL